MLRYERQRYAFECIDSGVDWLTATQKHGEQCKPFLEAGEAILDQERAAGGDVRPATLRDYVGHKGQGFFIGSRPADEIVVLSGPRCPPHWKNIVQTAGNVSRLDIQASIWTAGETPQLGRVQYERLTTLPPARGRPRSYSLIQSHPHGETLYVGKRQSDQFGRVYDWSAAHKVGEAATVWRFEVELKRHLARGYSHALACASDPSNMARHLVHSWFLNRRLELPWSIEDSESNTQLTIHSKETDALAWMETSVSKTVARMINRYGVQRVVFALGLSQYVRPVRKENKTNGAKPARSLSAVSVRRNSRTDD